MNNKQKLEKLVNICYDLVNILVKTPNINFEFLLPKYKMYFNNSYFLENNNFILLYKDKIVTNFFFIEIIGNVILKKSLNDLLIYSKVNLMIDDLNLYNINKNYIKYEIKNINLDIENNTLIKKEIEDIWINIHM